MSAADVIFTDMAAEKNTRPSRLAAP